MVVVVLELSFGRAPSLSGDQAKTMRAQMDVLPGKDAGQQMQSAPLLIRERRLVGRDSGQSVQEAKGRGLSALGVPCGFDQLDQTSRVHTRLLEEALQVRHVKLALLKATDALAH